ncbi:TraG family conjugative transposon ATPase [Pedobacter sp. MW01-1-1]|uniref:TraG family conjugative transposon ATPase n=1 Tax=Pedobacter sp. MW01-1-1 TaxID=3383027 RepID=UPI003FF119A9
MVKQKEFRIPYLGIDIGADLDILYGMNGEFSVLISLTNPVICFGGDYREYDNFHDIFSNLARLVGEGYTLQKQDIINRVQYNYEVASEFLQDSFNRHFDGRSYVKLETVLTITRQVRKGTLYVHDKKLLAEFKITIAKVLDMLGAFGMKPRILREREINLFIMRIMAMDFSDGPISLDNYYPNDTEVNIGTRSFRSVSLINIDQVDLPALLPTSVKLSDKESLKGFPADILSFLFKVPDCNSILYNQLLEIPYQRTVVRQMELKRKRHSGIPDPANNLCVEDITLLLDDVARDGNLLVNAHFNIIVCAEKALLSRAYNYIESSLFRAGIIPSKNAYNQLELFRTSFPGNAAELRKYDWFLTTAEAAICLFFKESLAKDEKSGFLVRFTDRVGIPISIDPADVPMSTGRISNRNKFVLGPSGTGKSFFMNSLLEQYLLYNMDVVIIDTGHSYSGLSRYAKGRYITYSDNCPITMNPFAISEQEYTIEKKDFILTLILLCLKGPEGEATQLERDVISEVISSYYAKWFSARESSGIKKLDFDSFYGYSVVKIPEIMKENSVPFDFDSFKFILRKFCSGGEFGTILNEDADSSLLNERLIIFEIDNLKDHRILFPIVTLIIMDIFIQKMRHRNFQRKAIIIEEAWKAISSPLMVGFLVYLYKTVRKFWGEVMLVTQDLADVVGNVVVKDTIVSSSSTVILLDQAKFRDNYDEIAAMLSITSAERNKIFSINQLDNHQGRSPFKEVYIRRGDIGEVYGVEVSLAQYMTYTTEKPEKLAIEKYLRRFETYSEALNAFIFDFENSSLSLTDFVKKINSSS